MSIAAPTDTDYVAKTRDLCANLLSDEGYREARVKIDQFLADDASKATYIELNQLGNELEAKRQSGHNLTDEEIDSFSKKRDSMLANPVISNFMEAEGEIQKIHQTIMGYVSKTLEMGRLPTDEELQASGCCGGGGGGG